MTQWVNAKVHVLVVDIPKILQPIASQHQHSSFNLHTSRYSSHTSTGNKRQLNLGLKKKSWSKKKNMNKKQYNFILVVYCLRISGLYPNYNVLNFTSFWIRKILSCWIKPERIIDLPKVIFQLSAENLCIEFKSPDCQFFHLISSPLTQILNR